MQGLPPFLGGDSGHGGGGLEDVKVPTDELLGGRPPSMGGRDLAGQKEDVLRHLGRLLVLPLPANQDGKYRTPVVTLHNTEASNLYSLLERTLRTEFCVGGERFWKVNFDSRTSWASVLLVSGQERFNVPCQPGDSAAAES